MNKRPKKVKKDPKRQELARKSHETYMKRLIEDILRDNQISNSLSTNNTTPSTILLQITLHLLPLPPHLTLSLNLVMSIYDVDTVTVPATGAYVFFAYNKGSS